MTSKHLLPAVCLASLACSAHAVTLVDFGGDYVSTNTNLVRTVDTTGSRIFGAGIDTVTARNYRRVIGTQPAADYSGPAFTYGFEVVTRTNGGAAITNGYTTNVADLGTADAVNFFLSNVHAFGRSTTRYALFDLPSSTLGSQLDSYSLTISNIGTTSAQGTVLARALVRSGTDWYVPSTSIASSATTVSLDAAAIGTLEWSFWGTTAQLTTGADTSQLWKPDFTTTLASISGLSIDAIGVFSQSSTAVAASSNSHFQFSDFTVTAVPEPSAFSAIAGLAGLGFAASRRRRRA